MRASPGSRVTPAAVGLVSSDTAIRRDDSTNCRASAAPVARCRRRRVRTGTPARRAAARTAPASKGRLARTPAVARTSSVSWAKLARERARGPFGVWTDSRISKRPLGRVTTYAIPTMLPTT